jgi:outer membrane protein OmpA-like peptidoglycan-associated protein
MKLNKYSTVILLLLLSPSLALADRIFKDAQGNIRVDMPEYPVVLYPNKEVKLINKKFPCKSSSQQSYLYDGASLTCSSSEISLAAPDGSFSYSYESGDAELVLHNGVMEQKTIILDSDLPESNKISGSHFESESDSSDSIAIESDAVRIKNKHKKSRIAISDSDEFDADEVAVFGQALGGIKIKNADKNGKIVIDSGDGDSIVIDGGTIEAKSGGDSWRIVSKEKAYDSKKVMKELKVSQSGSELKIDLPDSVLFDFSSYELKQEASDSLSKVAFLIKQKSTGKVILEGHTDSIGSEEANLKLSKQRIQSVASWLIKKEGIPAELLEGKGYGESKPVAHNTLPDGSDDPTGREKNRRVSFKFSSN